MGDGNNQDSNVDWPDTSKGGSYDKRMKTSQKVSEGREVSDQPDVVDSKQPAKEPES